MITAKHLIAVAFMLLSLAGVIHAQDRSPLRDGFYEAEDIQWERGGEWTRKTLDGVTWYSSSYSGSWLRTQVDGLWIVFYPYREYGPARTFMKLNECFVSWESKSAHEVPRALIYALDGPTTIEFQAIDGRSGLDAIEVITDEKRAHYLSGQSRVYSPWQPAFSDCVKQDVTPTPQTPWTNEVHREKPLDPMEWLFHAAPAFIPLIGILAGFAFTLGLLVSLFSSEKQKNG